jgi:hypothetical protein
MRELFADFNSLDEDPDLGRFTALGTESRNEELHGLEEGEHVLLKEPDELQAEDYVVSRMVRGERWWLGVLAGDIEVIAQPACWRGYGQPTLADVHRVCVSGKTRLGAGNARSRLLIRWAKEDVGGQSEVRGQLLDVREREPALAREHLGDDRRRPEERHQIGLAEPVLRHQIPQRVHPARGRDGDVRVLIGLQKIGEPPG